jgi:hypothetical protein
MMRRRQPTPLLVWEAMTSVLLIGAPAVGAELTALAIKVGLLRAPKQTCRDDFPEWSLCGTSRL